MHLNWYSSGNNVIHCYACSFTRKADSFPFFFFFPFFFYLGPSALQATPTDGSTWRLKDGRKYALVNVALYQV